MARNRCWTVALAAAWLAACAAPPPVDWRVRLAERGWALGDEVGHLRDVRIGGFDALDSRHVVLFVGDGRRVLATVSEGCTTLRSATRLGTGGIAGQLGRGDTLLVLAPGMPERCVIESLHRVS